MRKIILPAIIILSAHFASIAQPVSRDARVEFQKADKSGAVIELPYNTDVVEATIKDNMLKQGIKEDRSKGFQVFKGVRLTPSDAEVTDLYFKVDRKSRKENDMSVVSLIVGRPNENVALRTGDDAFKVEDAKTYLNSMTPSVEAYNLEIIITQQDVVIKKAEKHLNDLQDDQRDYEKKISNFNEKLMQTRRDIEIQTADVTKQKAAKDAMLLRRTTPVTTN